MKILKLQNIAEIVMGQSPEAEFVSSDKIGLPLLNGPAEFTDRYPVPVQFTSLGKRIAEEKDILFCVRGSTTGRMNIADQKYAIGRGLAAIRHKKNPKLNPYVKALIEVNLKKLLGGTLGSVFPNITKDNLFDLECVAHDESNQQKIASILSAIDDKIELNNKINAELEGMAKLIYDYWFVQFDFPYDFGQGKPADETSNPKDVKPYKSSGGKMVWNKELKREVPEGWGVKELGKYANIKKGTLITEKTADTSGNIKVVSAGLGFSYHHSSPNFPKNTITISASGASAGFINFWREPIFACDCITVRGGSEAETLFILGFLKVRQEYLYSQARGSAQPHVYPKDIDGLHIAIPDKGLIKKFGELTVPGNNMISINLNENQQLSSLRDWLLPMLMNGQVRVD
ncbi:restriction endonuclease subunit S [Fontibacter flavus]|uniref:Restriction endonuclease subunit S n=1 Tax=Fontibacter flavus TaxID=654838 RepID=A0ABV6FR63_9BACT